MYTSLRASQCLRSLDSAHFYLSSVYSSGQFQAEGGAPMQAILVEPPSGSEAPVWRGPLPGDKSEAAITMDAYAFDSIVSTFLGDQPNLSQVWCPA